jgi:hypothetical protein
MLLARGENMFSPISSKILNPPIVIPPSPARVNKKNDTFIRVVQQSTPEVMSIESNEPAIEEVMEKPDTTPKESSFSGSESQLPLSLSNMPRTYANTKTVIAAYTQSAK